MMYEGLIEDLKFKRTPSLFTPLSMGNTVYISSPPNEHKCTGLRGFPVGFVYVLPHQQMFVCKHSLPSRWDIKWISGGPKGKVCP